MQIFFEILQNLSKLDLIVSVDRQFNKLDIRSVALYSVSEEDSEVVVSQTKPPLGRHMRGQEIEASFVASLKKDELERFFFLARIKGIGLFPITKSRLVEVIFLSPVQKEIYKRSLRLYSRLECHEDHPIHVEIIPGNEILSVRDISKGELCFLCPKNMLNSIRYIPHKKLNMKIKFPEKKDIEVEGEVVRRFEKEDIPEMYHVGVKFLNFPKGEENELDNILTKLKEGK